MHTKWLLVLTQRLCADKRKRSSRTEEPFLPQKVGKDQEKKKKKRSSRTERPFLSPKIGEDQKETKKQGLRRLFLVFLAIA